MKHTMDEAYGKFVQSLKRQDPQKMPMTMAEFEWEINREKKKIKKEGRKQSSVMKLATALATKEAGATTKKTTKKRKPKITPSLEKGMSGIKGNYRSERSYVEAYVKQNRKVIAQRFKEYGATGDDDFDDAEMRRFVNRVMSKISTPTGQAEYEKKNGYVDRKALDRAIMSELTSSAFSSREESNEYRAVDVLNFVMDNGKTVRDELYRALQQWAQPSDVHTIKRSSNGKTVWYEVLGCEVKVEYSPEGGDRPHVTISRMME